MRILTLSLAICAGLSCLGRETIPIGVEMTTNLTAAERLIILHGLRERINVDSHDEYVGDVVTIHMLARDKDRLLIPDLSPIREEMQKAIEGKKVDVPKLVKADTKEKKWVIRDSIVFGVPRDDDNLLRQLWAVEGKNAAVSRVVFSEDHPISQGVGDWSLPTATRGVSATGNTIELDQDGLIWAVDKGDSRVVATTIEPDLNMLTDPRFLDFLARAVLWVADEIQDNGWPKPGYGGNGDTEFVEAIREALNFVPQAAPTAIAETESEVDATVPTAAKDWTITFDEREARYLSLEITSPQTGGDFATLAEFVVLDADGKELPRDDWRVVSSSSEQPPKQKAENILDGDITTIWHSRYINGVAKYPHNLRIDMRSSQTISGVICKPREGSKTGLIKGYRLYASDGAGRGDLISKGEF